MSKKVKKPKLNLKGLAPTSPVKGFGKGLGNASKMSFGKTAKPSVFKF